MKTIRLGAGSAFWGDALEPALDLARHGNVQYLGFDHLAELTMAILYRQKQRDPKAGFIPDVLPWMESLLPETAPRGIRTITNGGGANPLSAAEEIRKLPAARRQGTKIGVVLGDDVTERVMSLHREEMAFPNLDTGDPDMGRIASRVVAACAYLGSDGIVDLLSKGADIVLTGRNTDNSLFVAPMIHEFGWHPDRDVHRIASGIVTGHIIECTCMCMGGASNFWAEVPKPWNIGFPIAEVGEDGSSVITKLPQAGGMVTTWTVKEHLVYEIHDPRSYRMADGVADLTTVRLEQEGKDRVRVSGVQGQPRPENLKVLIAYEDGFIGEATVYFPWPDAIAKAHRAEEVLRKRFERWADRLLDLQVDRLGVNALMGPAAGPAGDPNEVGIRVAFKTRTKDDIGRIKREIVHLWTAGGVGAAIQAPTAPRPVIGLWPTLIPRAEVPIRTELLEAA